MSGKALYSKVWVCFYCCYWPGQRGFLLWPPSLRDQLKLLLTPFNGPGKLRLRPDSGQFCQSSDKELEETENLASNLWSHPVPPSGLSCLQEEFIGNLRLLAGT